MEKKPQLGLPQILETSVLYETPWLKLLKKKVDFGLGRSPEDYYSVTPRDYVVIYAETPEGHIPIVHQYRPAVEGFTWELPAGLLEENETPEECCRRELKEETGLDCLSVQSLGAHYIDTGRMTNRQHIFKVKASAPPESFTLEPGLLISFVTVAELKKRILSGIMQPQLHWAAILRCWLEDKL